MIAELPRKLKGCASHMTSYYHHMVWRSCAGQLASSPHYVTHEIWGCGSARENYKWFGKSFESGRRTNMLAIVAMSLLCAYALENPMNAEAIDHDKVIPLDEAYHTPLVKQYQPAIYTASGTYNTKS